MSRRRNRNDDEPIASEQPEQAGRDDAANEVGRGAGGRGATDRGNQKGSQMHAEGQHGEKTHARFIEQLHEGPHELPAEARLAEARRRAAYEGKRRLVEDRQQHDEAEKNSERKRLFIEHQDERDDGPSDNRGSLHGVLGHREHRADYKARDQYGLREKGQD